MRVEYTYHTDAGDIVGEIELPDDSSEDQIEDAVLIEAFGKTELRWKIVQGGEDTA